MEPRKIPHGGNDVTSKTERILDGIEKTLATRTPQTGAGDHALNPGMAAGENLRAAAVLILLIPREDGLTVLFTERTTTLPTHAGQVSFPGGGVDETDADDIQTALREAQEEIGLDVSGVRVLGVLDEYVTRTDYAVRPVVAVLEKDQVWRPNAGEVAKIFEVPLDYVLSAGALEKKSVAFEGRERHFFALDWDEFHIWGATAGMLHAFADVVRPFAAAQDKTPAAPDAADKKTPPANTP